jgi:hypothetical protein
MTGDPITGNTFRWTFTDGPMAGKTFQHTFGADGGVTFREVNAATDASPAKADKYETAALGDDVHAVSYLSDAGFTLTAVLDFRSREVVAFASSDQQLVVQRGTFEPLGRMPI